MANNSLSMLKSFAEMESDLNIYLQQYKLSLFDIHIESGDIISDVLGVIQKMIITQFQMKCDEKRISFELQLQQFLYMYELYCSGRCRDSVLDRCENFLAKYNLNFADFVVDDEVAAQCVMSMLKKIITRLFEQKCADRESRFQSEKEKQFVILEKYFIDKLAQQKFSVSFNDLFGSYEDLSEEEKEEKEEGGGEGICGEEGGGVEICGVEETEPLIPVSRTNSEENILQCIAALNRLSEECAEITCAKHG